MVDCSSAARPGNGDTAARFLAVHSTLRTMGLTQVGAIHRGYLREGQTVGLPLSLGASCTTIVAFASNGARQVLLELAATTSPTPVKRASSDTDAVLHACVESPGDYQVRLRMVQGSGDFLVSAWSGEGPRGGSDGKVPNAVGGSCEAPAVLLPGLSYPGTTEDAPDEHQGSCGSNGGREQVYRLDVRRRQRIKIEVSAQFDSVLYVRKGECLDDSAEMECNDDAPGGVRRSQVEALFEPGTYFVFVDGYADEAGRYRIRATAEDAPTLAEVCRDAVPLVTSARVSARLTNPVDNVHASCGREARGGDVAYRFELAARARVRFTEKSTDFRPVLHVRRNCEDEASEIGCSESGRADDEAVWTGRLEPGAYTVFADSAEENVTGTFSLAAEALPEPAPPGMPGDACGDAISLGSPSGEIEGDTFSARDDLSSSCAAAGAADVVYRLDIPRRARLSASLASDEGRHVLSLVDSCAAGIRGSCGVRLQEDIAPGTYFLVVDAKNSEAFGRFSLHYRVLDLLGLESACSKAQPLVMSRAVEGSMTGARDDFETGCGGSGPGKPGADRVYRFSLARPQSVRLALRAQGFRARLAIRRACAEEGAELACLEARQEGAELDLRRDLEPGSYFVVVETASSTAAGGKFWLSLTSEKSTRVR